jgi:SAM-dependent methyltransferase
MTADYWQRDPRRLAFVLARYKFVARMLEGKDRVLEVGCADGFGSRIVRQHVGALTAVDLDRASISEAVANNEAPWTIEFRTHDILESPMPGFAAVYCLDVLEHIDQEKEALFLHNVRECAPVAIIGAPSLESQPYASELSREGHINCKTGPELKRALQRYWSQVFLFGMNDETLHTGFAPMAHYRMALCVA